MTEYLIPRSTGGSTGSALPTEGAVRNLSVTPGPHDAATATFALEQSNGTRSLAMHLDGRLVDLLPGDVTTGGVSGLDAGAHTLSVSVVRDGETPDVLLFDPQGQRALLSWDAATASDVAAYLIYWDEGAGGTPDTLLATISSVEIQSRESAAPDTGSGTGRIDVGGFFTGTPPINFEMTLSITGAGEYSWDYDGASGSGTFGHGDTLTLPDGVQVSFLDETAAYETGDSWTFRVGLATTYLSGQLDPGSYQFQIVPVDAAGNPGTETSVRTVLIEAIPDPVSAVTTAWNAATETLTVSWTPPASCDSVRLYSNWNPSTQTFEDSVREDYWIASLAPGSDSWTLTSPPDGTLLFYIRPELDGIERRDITLHEYAFPVTPEQLGAVLSDPAQIAATAKAGATVLVEWLYLWSEGDSLDSFDVWISTGAVDFSTPASVNVPVSSSAGVRSYSYTSGALVDGTTYHVGVRAKTAAGVTTTNTDTVTVVADGTGPAYAGDLIAGPA